MNKNQTHIGIKPQDLHELRRVKNLYLAYMGIDRLSDGKTIAEFSNLVERMIINTKKAQNDR